MKTSLPNYRSEGENYDKFKFAFNIEQKFILQQNKMENVQVSNYEKSRYLPPDIFIKSRFVQSVIKATADYAGKAPNKYMKTVSLRAPSPDFTRLNGDRWDAGCVMPLSRPQSPESRLPSPARRRLLSPLARPVSSCAVPRQQRSLTVRSFQ